MNDLYNRIEDRAREKGLTIGGLCVKAGVYKSRLADLKNGRTKTLNTEIIRKLANVLGTTPEALLYGKDDKRILHVDMDEKKLDARLLCKSMTDEELLRLISAATLELQGRKNKEGE